MSRNNRSYNSSSSSRDVRCNSRRFEAGSRRNADLFEEDRSRDSHSSPAKARRRSSNLNRRRQLNVSSPPQKVKKKVPICVQDRVQDLSNLYTYQDWMRDVIRDTMVKMNVHVPFLPKLIVEYVPLYYWTQPDKSQKLDSEKDADFMAVKLSHCDTIASNDQTKFGAVLGTKLDMRCDHVISVRLDEGIEFGLGLCDEWQSKTEPTKRDFMCCSGGFGYYNYKTKSPRMKPKYPPGLYCQTNACHNVRDEEKIVKAGDTLTMVIQRQDVFEDVRTVAPGGGLESPRSQAYRLRRTRGPVKTTKPGIDGLVSLSYFLNGKPMDGFNLVNLRGPFFLCLNYYFVESTIRLLSNYRFRAVHARHLREQAKRCDAAPRERSSRISRGPASPPGVPIRSEHMRDRHEVADDELTIDSPVNDRRRRYRHTAVDSYNSR